LPLAIAANITQSAHCRLDEVLITFGKLVMEYQKLEDPIETDIKAALLSSIEKWWEKFNQDVFVAAVILNPFYKILPFKHVPTLVSHGVIYSLFLRLWKQFYSSENKVPNDLYEFTQQYLSNTYTF